MYDHDDNGNPNVLINRTVPSTIDTVFLLADCLTDNNLPYVDTTWHRGGYDRTLFVPCIVAVN